MNTSVIKRNGSKEKVSPDKILKQIERIVKDLHLENISIFEVAQETISGIHDEIHTSELDELAANVCASKIIIHPEYSKLAAGITINNLHKKTPNTFYDAMLELFLDEKIEPSFFEIIETHRLELDKKIKHNRDYRFDFFGIKTLERSYLLKNNKNIIVERPQYMYMRVALAIHLNDIKEVLHTYELMSQGYFTHATPTLFNAGTKYNQMSSCFLLGVDDNLESIYKGITDAAMISKRAGGIGIHIHDIRPSGRPIKGTGGTTDNIVKMCKVFNDTAKYVNQGGKRNGSIALYLEPHHGDIFDFIDLRKNIGKEESRARDLFLALWISDLFIKRVIEDGVWSLMSPDQSPGLSNVYGNEYENLYTQYEKEGKYIKQIRARDLWDKIIENQIETGMPYISYKDNANNKTNHQNLGTIKSSNLCCEIYQYSDSKEYATCNLASIALPKFLEADKNGNLVYNFDKLIKVAKVATRNLNKIIDNNYYPVPETKISNDKHRPIGVGVQGLATLYQMLELPFYSNEAKLLNKQIFEAIYYGCVSESNALAKKDGPYESFQGSPFSKGILQYHMWDLTEDDLLLDKCDWKTLINNIKKYGMRNSLLTALMPTASTSHILGNSECFEPLTSNLFMRKTLAGEFAVVNENLVKLLTKHNLWNEDIKKQLLYYNGSVQKINFVDYMDNSIPNIKKMGLQHKIKQIYLTAYELSNKHVIDQAAERGPFIDQSQSMNLYIKEPNFNEVHTGHIYGWKKGLKTGLYYLRSLPVKNAINFGLDQTFIERMKNKDSNDHEPECIACGS